MRSKLDHSTIKKMMYKLWQSNEGALNLIKLLKRWEQELIELCANVLKIS
jgi:hypothetical protein